MTSDLINVSAFTPFSAITIIVSTVAPINIFEGNKTILFKYEFCNTYFLKDEVKPKLSKVSGIINPKRPFSFNKDMAFSTNIK
ncbi:hypothetical protein ES705_48044 [subsurface metagenome]